MLIIFRWLSLALISLSIVACSSDNLNDDDDQNTSSGEFQLESLSPINVLEGDNVGAEIPVILNRQNGHDKDIIVSITGLSDADDRLMSYEVSPSQLNGGQSASSIKVRLAIDNIPIQSQQRTLVINATDGVDNASTRIFVNVQPVNAPDVYLLLGQSNMVGFSGDGTKLSDVGGPDEPNPRILQLNVSKNNAVEVFNTTESYTATSSNIIEDNPIVVAEDPLHIPVDPSNTSGKDLSYIGMGLSFAKNALNNTTQDIVLVPAAWSGSSFCTNEGAPTAHWNSEPTTNPELGNTLLFDRAVTRVNLALAETGGILRGILWHQGEQDSNDRCANVYLANLERLAQQLRVRIAVDARGIELRQPDSNIPFVLGTMSRGADENGDLSVFNADKQIIDDAHKTLPSQINNVALASGEDLTPANGYPCGNSNCIHYGASALREFGGRYYDALVRAATSE